MSECIYVHVACRSGLELGAVVPRPARRLRVYPLAAGLPERVDLHVEALVRGADPGVSDVHGNDGTVTHAGVHGVSSPFSAPAAAACRPVRGTVPKTSV